jgi:hypothetical protein
VTLPRRRVIRQSSDASTHSTLTSLWETRRVRVAQGIQFHASQIQARIDAHNWGHIQEDMGRYLQTKGLPGLQVDSAGNITYESRHQHVRYEVTFTESKSDFKTMLGTENLLAVYAGHARHGLGPCFGDSGMDQPPRPQVPHRGRTESWCDGSGSSTGLFRMGKRYILMPVDDDVSPLGYSPRLVPWSADQPLARDECDVDVLAHYSRLGPYTLGELGITHALHGTVDPDGIYWGARVSHAGRMQPHAVLEGGWENTAAAPYELGATEIKCRALVLIACTGLRHWHSILRRHWPRTEHGNDLYMLDRIGTLAAAGFWIHRLFTYPVMNAWHPWRGALEYAKRMANIDIAALDQEYRMVTS